MAHFLFFNICMVSLRLFLYIFIGMLMTISEANTSRLNITFVLMKTSLLMCHFLLNATHNK